MSRSRVIFHRFPVGGKGLVLNGDYPYQTQADRGKVPIFADDRLLEQQKKASPTPPSGSRGSRTDSINVSNTAITVILSPVPFERWVRLRARGASVTISTNSQVAVNGGEVLPAGESQPTETLLPAGVALYGIAAAANAAVARVVRW